jgi:2-polyprenyl-6-methoxyphenol hydroxylase-like FAD-dependent oxidoreductase
MNADLGVLEVGWKSRFHCDERQVAHYRHGRVFLAGDAAHVHSPMGGQGMNTGIQDAANLAWKIAAVLGGADDTVLDSYQDERHPIGKRALLQSGMMARGVTLHPRVARGMRNRLAPRILRALGYVTREQGASRAPRCGIPTGQTRSRWWAPGQRRFR